MTTSRVWISGGTTLTDDGYLVLTSDPPTGDGVRFRPEAAAPLPFGPASLEAVVVTETFEFLDPGAVFRLLLEIHRGLRADGRLLVEIPDFVGLLGEWDDSETPARFCTYRYPADAPGAWRTPKVDAATLDALRRSGSPMRLAIDLANLVVDREPGCRFGRQSAWDGDELAATLRAVGFEVLPFDDTMVERLSDGFVAARAEGRIRCLAAPAPVRPPTGDLPAGAASARAATMFEEGVALAHAGRHDEAMRLLRDAIRESPSLGERHYRLVWDLYVRALRATVGIGIAPSPTFAAEGRHLGRIGEEIVASVRRELDQAPVVPVTAADAAPGYLSNPNLTADAEAAINRDNAYLALGHPALAAAGPLFEALAGPVEACLGTPFRIVNVRSWRTEANASRVEANGWHRDEPYPAAVLKVIVYLTEAGPETGSTEVVHTDGTHSFVVGPAGTFLVFQNAELVHRGTPPVRETRAILEVTVTPHPTRDLRPVCAGQNADFPFSPWLPLEPWMVRSWSSSRSSS
jgi:hypothetical protein